MKKILLAGVVSTTLLISSVVPVLADDTQTAQQVTTPQITQTTAVGTTDTSSQTTVDPSNTVQPTTQPNASSVLQAQPADSSTDSTTSSAIQVTPSTQPADNTTGTVTQPLELGKYEKALLNAAGVKNVDLTTFFRLKDEKVNYQRIALVMKLSELTGKSADDILAILQKNESAQKKAEEIGVKAAQILNLQRKIQFKALQLQPDRVKILKQEEAKAKKLIEQDKKKLLEDQQQLKFIEKEFTAIGAENQIDKQIDKLKTELKRVEKSIK